MLKLTTRTRVYLSLKATDMRCGIFSLAAQVESVFSKNYRDGNLYVFVSKDKKKIKVIAWEEDGYWLHYKRLAVGTFQVRLNEHGREEISGIDFKKLLSGISLAKIKLSNKVRKEVARN